MCELKTKNSVKNSQKVLNIYAIKKNILCVYSYKMVEISKKTYENSDIEVIVQGIGALWLNEKDIEQKLGHKNVPVITNKYDPIFKKRRYE